jgi:hypothetical protein
LNNNAHDVLEQQATEQGMDFRFIGFERSSSYGYLVEQSLYQNVYDRNDKNEMRNNALDSFEMNGG